MGSSIVVDITTINASDTGAINAVDANAVNDHGIAIGHDDVPDSDRGFGNLSFSELQSPLDTILHSIHLHRQ